MRFAVAGFGQRPFHFWQESVEVLIPGFREVFYRQLGWRRILLRILLKRFGRKVRIGGSRFAFR